MTQFVVFKHYSSTREEMLAHISLCIHFDFNTVISVVAVCNKIILFSCTFNMVNRKVACNRHSVPLGESIFID